jgi:hypothetical protein
LPKLDLLETYIDAVLAKKMEGAEWLGLHVGALVVSLCTVLVQLTSLWHLFRQLGLVMVVWMWVVIVRRRNSCRRIPCSWSLLMAMAAGTAVVLLLSFAEEDVKAIQAKVVGLPKRLVIDDRALRPWLTQVI